MPFITLVPWLFMPFSTLMLWLFKTTIPRCIIVCISDSDVWPLRVRGPKHTECVTMLECWNNVSHTQFVCRNSRDGRVANWLYSTACYPVKFCLAIFKLVGLPSRVPRNWFKLVRFVCTDPSYLSKAPNVLLLKSAYFRLLHIFHILNCQN